MLSWPRWLGPDLSKVSEIWRLRARTLEAAGWLIAARFAVGFIGIERWRGHLGLAGAPDQDDIAEARRLARHVDRAAGRMLVESKCLPRAIALSRMLRCRGIAHRLVIAARPAGARSGADDLHAWIELGGTIVLGALPGTWIQVLGLP